MNITRRKEFVARGGGGGENGVPTFKNCPWKKKY